MIGLFVLAAITIVVFILLFIHPNVGDEGKTLHVRFSNIDKVNIGTRVSFAGKPVGEVVDIIETLDKSNPRPSTDGQVYAYELTLAVDSSVNVYNTDEISLRTSGLLGEKSINITPLPPKPGTALTLINDKIIYADETGSVEDAFKEIKSLSDKFNSALNAVIDSLDDIKKNNMWEKIAGTFANLEDISGAVNKPEELSLIIDNFSTLSNNIVDSWATIDEAIENVALMTDNGKLIIEDVRNGKGTVGKIVMSDDLYLRLNAVMNKAQITMNDINHYGLLFHLDKNWQRLRARRLNLLQKLACPQEFRNYFNDEIDQITTSLSRVYMVLNKKNPYARCPNVIKDVEFVKVFSELMRRVEDVEEQLHMYNIQLQEPNVYETELSGCCR